MVDKEKLIKWLNENSINDKVFGGLDEDYILMHELLSAIISGSLKNQTETCRWKLDNDFKYCPYCGKEIEEMKD